MPQLLPCHMPGIVLPGRGQFEHANVSAWIADRAVGGRVAQNLTVDHRSLTVSISSNASMSMHSL